MNTLQKRSTKLTLGVGLALGGFALANQQPQVHADTNNNSTSSSNTTSTQNTATQNNNQTTKTYTVKAGDTLSGIAASNNTTVTNLEAANGLTNDTIYTGQTLQLQAPKDVADSNGNYTVQAGDTLSAIASANNISVDTLMANNNLNSDTILVGQVLQINNTQSLSNSEAQSASTPTVNTGYQSSTMSSTDATTTTTSAAPVTSTTNTNTETTTNTQNTNSTTPTQTQSASTQTSDNSANTSDAKAWIASHESGGSYTAQNGNYYGKYQLSSSYLGGDYSPQHQEEVADHYVSNRYGSWENAKSFWQTHGWY